MLKIMPFAILIITNLLLALPAPAHHGVDHDPKPVPAAPAAPASPPPPPPPPPPVLPAPVLPQVQVQLPTILPGMVVPTDVAGLAGSLGSAKGIKAQLSIPGKAFKGARHQLIARDPRFSFTGDWQPLLDSNNHESQPEGKSTNNTHVGKVEQWDVGKGDDAPLFMPTAQTNYQINGNELVLSSGAVLVRADHRAAFVTVHIDGKKISVRVINGLAFVANVDGKPVILNLTDRCCGAVVAYLPGESGHHKVNLGVGEIFEIHHKDDKPFTTYVSSKVLTHQQLSSGLHLQVSRCHYLSAMHRYNLDKALKKNDLHRVLKTAAALACVNPGSKP